MIARALDARVPAAWVAGDEVYGSGLGLRVAWRPARWLCACPGRNAQTHCHPGQARFHVVQLAVKVTGDVRRRVAREKYGRRGRSGDPEDEIKGLLVRNLEPRRVPRVARLSGFYL